MIMRTGLTDREGFREGREYERKPNPTKGEPDPLLTLDRKGFREGREGDLDELRGELVVRVG